MNAQQHSEKMWDVARIAVLGTLFIVGAHVWYRNGWSPDDFKSLAMLIGGSLGFDALKNAVTKKESDGNG